jgi:murein DD-endopeptidase MepM/ murein hydrolase activator NlpD
MTPTMRVVLGFLAVGALAAAMTAFWMRGNSAAPPPPPVETVFVPSTVPPPDPVTETLTIENGDTLEKLLDRAGIERDTKFELIGAVSRSFDVRRFRAGQQLMLTRHYTGAVESMEYAIDPDHKLELVNANGTPTASVVEIPGVVRPASVCAKLEGSLFLSLTRIGEHPELALRMAEIFAWDIDFYTDPREGDEFCVLVEKKEYENGQPHTYRRILAATYRNGSTPFDAFLFPGKDGKPRYFAGDGRSLQSSFLKSPLRFEARVSSHFSHRRFHPVLKIHRPHLGTDYAAPTGTPVQSVASGRVVFSGYSGGAGNYIRIQHANGYESHYMHLSARAVKAGDTVTQGQLVGRVGSTGLVTGPHLDFRLRKNGTFVNFEKLKPPPDTSIEQTQMAAFRADRDHYRALIATGAPAEPAVVAGGAHPEPVD